MMKMSSFIMHKSFVTPAPMGDSGDIAGLKRQVFTSALSGSAVEWQGFSFHAQASWG